MPWDVLIQQSGRIPIGGIPLAGRYSRATLRLTIFNQRRPINAMVLCLRDRFYRAITVITCPASRPTFCLYRARTPLPTLPVLNTSTSPAPTHSPRTHSYVTP